MVTIAAAIAVERWFVRATHALQQPVGPDSPSTVREANHLHLVVALLLGAMVGMISTLSVSEADARGQLISMLLIPVPMVPALTAGALLGGHRTLSLVWLALLMGRRHLAAQVRPPGHHGREPAVHGRLPGVLPAGQPARAGIWAG